MIMYGFDETPKTFIGQASKALLSSRTTQPYTTLIGRNNSGKTFLLRHLTMVMQGQGMFLGSARYYNFNSLSPYAPQKERRMKWFQQFRQQMTNSTQNLDQSPLNVQQAIAELVDTKRSALFKLVKEVLGSNLSLQLAYPENEMSQRYISCDGHNFSFASSGVRLVVSILTSLFDDEYEYFFIDEPELGVSPEAQGRLAAILNDEEVRTEYLPHAKAIFIATHSSIFLDRKRTSNNFTIEKNGDEITVLPVESLTEFNRIHFSLLGNRIEDLFLPSFVLFVEGGCEETYLTRVLELRFPGTKFNVMNATGDAQMKNLSHTINRFIPDLQTSPFRDRIIPILDMRHGGDVKQAIVKAGIPPDNIIVWNYNGIEHYYPESVLTEIYGGGGITSIIGDDVSRNGQTFKKKELAKRVTARLNTNTSYPDELVRKLLEKLKVLIV